ncbi:MAG TPA: lysophospholipid acyltransferase family protein, partial [Polyangiaceae bacterium]|nr:lysophospholipid acyltransferase family protein [Polyangiaceae bacterium]
RGPAARLGQPRVHPRQPPAPLEPSSAVIDERTAVVEAGLSDTDIDSEEAFELGIGARVVPPTTQYGEAFESPPPDPQERRSGDVEAQIRALEARLDGLIRQRHFADGAADAGAEGADPTPERRGPLAKTDSAPPAKVESPELPASDFISRKWGRSALRSRSEEFDDFGLDPSFEQRVKPIVEFLYRSYFRTTVEGIDNVPAEGRCIVVANHSGALPLDGLMLRAALRIEHKQKRDLRWLAEDFVYYLPFAGVFMNRVGAVRACPENAERLLEKEGIVGVFPEGVHGIKKLFQERYRLQRFGRGGYIRLCLRMRAPIVPCAIIGAEESSPLLYRLEGLTELVGLPYFPITPTFPLLGPAGLLPAPTKWRMRFGEPINLDNYGPEAADDHVLVGRLSERVRSSIQSMLDGGLRERRSVWFG